MNIYKDSEALKEAILNCANQVDQVETQFDTENGRDVFYIYYSPDLRTYSDEEIEEKDNHLEENNTEFENLCKEANIYLDVYTSDSWYVGYFFSEVTEKVLKENKLDTFEKNLEDIKTRFPNLTSDQHFELALKII